MADEHYPKASDIPGEKLPYPASQADMHPQPDSDLSNYSPAGKLRDKVAMVTGGDSGIGRAGAVAYAMEGDAIINTGSTVGLTGTPILINYSASKGAIHAFTKSLALYLGKRNIRVTCVVPGPA